MLSFENNVLFQKEDHTFGDSITYIQYQLMTQSAFGDDCVRPVIYNIY